MIVVDVLCHVRWVLGGWEKGGRVRGMRERGRVSVHASVYASE